MPFLGRVNFFFKDPTGKGWSETYFSSQADYSTTMAAAKVLLPLRVNLMGASVKLAEIRISDDDKKRDSLIYVPPLADQSTPYAVVYGDADFSDTCLLIRCESSALNRRQLYMSALPDSMTTPTGGWSPSPLWLSSYSFWKTEMNSGRWGLKKQQNSGAAVNVVTVTQNALTGDLEITTALPHSLAVGDLCNVNGARNTRGLNGRHVVNSVISATVFTFASKFFWEGYSGVPTVYKLGFAFGAFSDVISERITKHSRGLPFDRSRGRQPAA